MTTSLSYLINRMKRYQALLSVEEQFLVRDLDDAIRTIKRSYDLPWFQKKSSLKVFSGVYEYPPASDHDYLIYLERTQQDIGFANKLRARYTSFVQFNEDPDYRNQVAEIWQNNTLTIGVRDKNNEFQGLQSQQLDDCSETTGYVASGDASNLAISQVNFKTGNSSLQFTVTNNTGVVLIEKTLDSSFTDALYLQKWHFRWLYVPSAPTSVQLRFGVDSSNYLLSAPLTTQFAGQAITPNQWNFFAMDLSTATTVGTINTSSVFNYDAIQLNGAPSGTYYLDSAYNKAWEMLDYWYYSKYAVQTVSATQADQESFFNSSDVYSVDSALVGDSEWADVVMYDAMLNSLTDKENPTVYSSIKAKRDQAWQAIEVKWPDMKPQMTTNRYRFGTEYTNPSYLGYWGGV
jgi:hypothetical protein